MPKKVMIYAASVVPGGVQSFTSNISHALDTVLAEAGWRLSILGKLNNRLQQPIDWPQSAFKALAQTQKSASEADNFNADLNAFRQLVDEKSEAFDVLYLPSPWGNIPLGTTLPIPAPVVMNIHDLEFEDVDYGSLTDQYRKEAEKFAKLGSAFIFSSEYVRERAIALYHFPRERTHVIHQAPTVTGKPLSDVRQKYHLPEKYIFSLCWLSRRKNGAALIEALGILKAKGLPSLPLVTAGYTFDDVMPENILHTEYGEQVKARIGELGLTDFLDLGVVDQADIPALIAGASLVIAPSKSESGLSYLMLDAMASGTPLIHARIPAVTERLGTDNTYARSFDPTNPEELAAQISDVLGNEAAARSRAEKAKTLIGQRTQADVAREYLDIFKAASQSPWETRPRQRTQTMNGREERVAWLLNHTTLRDSEIPVIRELGLEVYTCKEVPVGTGDQSIDSTRSMSVDYSEDENSTLPNWVLNRLNRHNFYNDGIPPDIAGLLDGYFGTVIVGGASLPLLSGIMASFSGRIVIRVFGRENPNNYTGLFTYFGGKSFWRAFKQKQYRFWFAPAYDSITAFEIPALQERALTLPLTLPDRTWRAANQWVGDDNRILFFCPRIGSDPEYYGKIYREFKEHLGHLPHLIAGNQPVAVDDLNVAGYVSDDQMQSWYRKMKVMFYHSREPRHLHYHPLEAVVYGMPLIYMKGGLVEEFMGKGKPGACDTFDEAAQKLKRILDGDEAFTRSVIESQSALLDTFRPDYVRQVWKDQFLKGIMNTSYIPDLAPFAQWKPLEKKLLPPTPIPSKTGRNIGVYVLMWPFGGVYKYITGLLDTAASLVESSNWQFDLIWGSPLIGDHGYPPLKWEYQPHSNLHFKILPQPSALSQAIRNLRQNNRVRQWRKSAIYLNHRPVRIIAEAVLFPLQYIYEAVNQRRLRPKGTQFYIILKDARIGRRALALPVIKHIFVDDPEELTTDQVTNFLAELPKPARVPKLTETRRPPFRDYLTIPGLEKVASQYEALLLGNPFRLISPNTPMKGLKRQPVAITMYDLAHEFTEVWAENSHAISREMVLWGKLAQIIVFGSEYIRDEAIKRYDIPFENTRIIRPSPLVIRWDAPQQEEKDRIRAKLGLPERYLFNTGYQGTHKNNIAIFQAMQILHWRGFDVPPLVLGGTDALTLLRGEAVTEYLAVLQKMIADGYWEIGKDLIIADYISEDDLPAVYGAATIGISMSRSESTVHGMITESMLYGAPVICSTIPQNTEELGPNGDVALMVPLDDPVALADAIEYTLNNPEDTKARVARASEFIAKKTWRKMAQEFLEVFEEIAASNPKR
ncbi:MAG: glycosyltransferase [Anaerolineaceae bacterium]|nr:glycosyltransferase [Anaerolineaceae bacterium]